MRLILATLFLCLSTGVMASAEEDRKEAQEMRQKVLTKLYAEKPEAKAEVEKSKGYAVFSSLGVNLLVVSTARGSGILRDNRDNSDTYMSMFSAGGGLGVGVKDFGIVFVFNDEAAMDEFVKNGWDFSAQADATVETNQDSEGMETAATVVPGVEIYQITDKGLALQATLQGTKYWKDDDLN